MSGVAGIVLAGGRSRRMGADKAGIAFEGRTLLARAVDRLAPQVDHVVLNLSVIPPSFDASGLSLAPDGVSGFAGPLAGALAGMDWAAAHGFADIVSVAVDTPFFPSDLVARLSAARAGGRDIVCAASGGRRHPAFLLASVELRADLAAFLAGGGRRVSEWLERHGAQEAEFHIAEGVDPFLNINTPEDLAHAEALARRGEHHRMPGPQIGS